MKKLLFAILTITSLSASAQVSDTVATNARLTKAMLTMRDNFKEAHDQFRFGWKIAAAGSAVIGLSFAIPGEKSSDLDRHTVYKTRNAGIIAGGFVALFGAVVMIDSHRYIGNSGRWRLTPTGVALDF